MKKALIYALALALALSLTACSQPKAEQPTDPAPSTSAPEPIVAPEPIKDTTPAPEPNEIKELSGTELLDYFQLSYDTINDIMPSRSTDEKISYELIFLEERTNSDGYTLPSDYEAQYRAWRPTDSLPADIQNQQEQQVSSTQQSTEQTQTQKSSTGQTQTQKPSSDTQQNQPTQKPSSSNQTQQQQPSQPSVGPDIYQGYGSYEALIDAACKELPELSREEIMDRIPDLSKTYVDWEQAAREAEEGLLTGGGTTQQQQQTQQPSEPQGGGDSAADIEARKQAFLNGMNQMFEDHGLTTDGKDHAWTEAEKQALLDALGQ